MLCFEAVRVKKKLTKKVVSPPVDYKRRLPGHLEKKLHTLLSDYYYYFFIILKS